MMKSVQGDDEEDDLEEDANALRTIEQPSDLLKSDAAPKVGLLTLIIWGMML